jgi:hypothetical protein
MNELDKKKADQKKNIARLTPICREPCHCKISWCKWHPCGHCTNPGCMKRVFKKAAACVKIGFYELWNGIISLLQKAVDFLLGIVKKIMEGVLKVIMFIIRIPEKLMMVASKAVEVAAKALAVMIKPFTLFPIFKSCIGCINFDGACFWRKFDESKMLRIYEIACSVKWKMDMSLRATFHILLFSKDIDITIVFSTNISDMLDSFIDLAKKYVLDIIKMIVDAFTCDKSVKT